MIALSLNNQAKEELPIFKHHTGELKIEKDTMTMEYLEFLNEQDLEGRCDSMIIVNEAEIEHLYSPNNKNHYDEISSALYSKPKLISPNIKSTGALQANREIKKLVVDVKKNPYSTTLQTKTKPQSPTNQTKQLYTIFEKVNPRWRDQASYQIVANPSRSPYFTKETNKSKSRENMNASNNSKSSFLKKSTSQEKKLEESKNGKKKNLLDQIAKIADRVSQPSTAASGSGASSLGKVLTEPTESTRNYTITEPTPILNKKSGVPSLRIASDGPSHHVNNFYSQREVYYYSPDSGRFNVSNNNISSSQNKSGVLGSKNLQIDSSREYQLEKNVITERKSQTVNPPNSPKLKTSQKIAKLKKKIPDEETYFINEPPLNTKPQAKEIAKDKSIKCMVSIKENKCKTPEVCIELNDNANDSTSPNYTSSLKTRIAETLLKKKIVK